MVQPAYRSTVGIFAILMALFSLKAEASAERPERFARGAEVTLGNPTVTLADRCNLAAPIATLHLTAHNRGNASSAPLKVTVLDSAHALVGNLDVPAVKDGEKRTIDVPLVLDSGSSPVPPRGTSAIAGGHVFAVYVRDAFVRDFRFTTPSREVASTIPATLCAQAIALSGAAPAAPPAASPRASATSRFEARMYPLQDASTANKTSTSTKSSANPATGAPLAGTPAQGLFGGAAAAQLKASTLPVVSATLPPRLTRPAGSGVTASALFPSPQNLRAVTSAEQCYGHFTPRVHNQSIPECIAMLSSGQLVLIWDMSSNAAADAYHVYPVSANGAFGAVAADVTDRARTLAQVSSTRGQCYVVTAAYGSAQSKPSGQFCAGAASNALTQTLPSSYVWSTYQDHSVKGYQLSTNDDVRDGLVVGYYQNATKDTFGDSSFNVIHRSAFAFPIERFKNTRIVSATLLLTIASSYSAQGNNHSCATTVSTGTEFWWKPDASSWLLGNFNFASAPISTLGPTVSADVTGLIAPMWNGAPNYGLVVRNDDENINAFTNAKCETVFTNPQLRVVYFVQ